VNKVGEDVGFGQSILKQSALIFDTPPYTTQGVSLLELHSEWRGEATHRSAKTPFTFKPSLLADLSHTSSSVPSNRSDRMSNYGSTLQSLKVRNTVPTQSLIFTTRYVLRNMYLLKLFSKVRRSSHPSQQPLLRRQSRVSDSVLQPGSESKLSLEEDTITAKLPYGQSAPVGRTASCSSDSKIGVDYFQKSTDFQDTISLEEDSQVKPMSRYKHPATVTSFPSGVTAEDSFDDETIAFKKVKGKW
jgi:hypothetical protein